MFVSFPQTPKDNYASFTVKGSDSVDEDVERFKELREVLGPDFPLEIDPNQAYTVHEACAAMAKSLIEIVA